MFKFYRLTVFTVYKFYEHRRDFRLEQYNVIIQDRLDLLFLALKAESKKLGKNNYSVAPFCHFIGELKSRPWEF